MQASDNFHFLEISLQVGSKANAAGDGPTKNGSNTINSNEMDSLALSFNGFIIARVRNNIPCRVIKVNNDVCVQDGFNELRTGDIILTLNNVTINSLTNYEIMNMLCNQKILTMERYSYNQWKVKRNREGWSSSNNNNSQIEDR